MTFSTKAVVDDIRDHWVPVWESVAPVRKATFDLGDGTSVEGTVSGEIAIYFCRPDGVVFDILPGLQSPLVTHAAMRDALAFYNETGATSDAIQQRHLRALSSPDTMSPETAYRTISKSKARLVARRNDKDPATRDLSEMAFSKVAFVSPEESFTLVEPGGLAIYKALVHDILSSGVEQTPEAWKVQLFEEILEQPLVGGEVVYDELTTGTLMFKD